MIMDRVAVAPISWGVWEGPAADIRASVAYLRGLGI
jgi:hypothetical protein